MLELLATVADPVVLESKEPMFLGSVNFWFGCLVGIVLGLFVWPILKSTLAKITRS